MSGRGQGYRGGRGADSRSNARDRRRLGYRRRGDGNLCERENGEHRSASLGFRELAELREREPADIVLTLVSPRTGFRHLLQAQSLSPDWIGLILAILKKACCQPVVPQNVNEIMFLIINSTFLQQHVSKYIANVTIAQSSATQQETLRQPLIDLLELLYKIMICMPTSYTSLMGQVVHVEFVVNQLLATSTVDNDKLEEHLTKVIELGNLLARRMREPSAILDEGLPLPPDDFRKKSIFPVPEDLHEMKRPYLRANKSKGTYENVEHYLDVQFRLLREDFVAPLRDGIHAYLNQKKLDGDIKQLQDIRVYFDVKIINPICTESGITHHIKFDIRHLKGVCWESSKRLIFGSLVCLSKDDFKTLFFATVFDRKPEQLAKGEIAIRFENSLQQVAEMSPEDIFVMAETSAYFEAYRHVLKGLQDTNEDNFPFKKYMIECQSYVAPPKYLENDSVLDLSTLLSSNVTNDGLCISVFNEHEWPNASLMNFDESQLRAVQTAFTNEFVIIQGPPGTGKTYIGLKIVKVLLNSENKYKWHSAINPETGQEQKKPLLVVCYTNHALDQFLEGIQEFHDEDIVRMGGRSKSKKLEKYVLKNIKQETHIPVEVCNALSDVREEMDELELQINRAVAQMKNAEEGIIHEKELIKYIDENHYKALITKAVKWMTCTKETSVIVEWLGLSNVISKATVDANANQKEYEYDPEDTIDRKNGEIEIEAEHVIQETRNIEVEHKANEAVALSLEQINQGSKERMHGAVLGWQVKGLNKKRMKQRFLRESLQKEDSMKKQEVTRIHNLWAMNLGDRWRLYRYWINLYCHALRQNIIEWEKTYEQAAERLQEIKMQEVLAIVRDATIIGMTTTGAAKYRAVLQQIKPRIVIVEEAAEVLEAHIVSALSDECEHCILIGDHKQLKPSANVFELATKYNLEISLFERMINNGVHYDCLELQHRMRPEIATFMKPIYPKLKNHESVLQYESIRGVSGNLYFIDHLQLENSDEDSRSKSNEHEARYIVALCRYLILQGYTTEQITILTMYTGQLFKIRAMMRPTEFFQGIVSTAVDNYQGEENDIVLLSLVRSNSEGSIGFMSVENRVCVALSRAKKALYVIGNFTLLSRSTKTDLWNKLVGQLRRDKHLTKSLPLYCQSHPETKFLAKTSTDFQKAPDGGCTLSCEHRLSCGHVCPRACHSDDQDHVKIQCMKPCPNVVCDEGHKCTKPCYEECGECLTMVNRILPNCDHLQTMPCYEDECSFLCQMPCFKPLAGCGHQCTNKCGEYCTNECLVMVKQTLPCKHETEFCYQMDDRSCASCLKPCKATLECGHTCNGTYGECQQGRHHVPCELKCDRILVCEHSCMQQCNFNCPPCSKRCQNRCSHSKCRKLCGQSCVPCKNRCVWQCPHYACSKLCSEPCDRLPCNVPCGNFLPCNHPCIGLCGEKCPDKCLICDRDEVTEIIFGTEDKAGARFVLLEDCNHVLEVSGLDEWMEQKADDSSKVDIRLKGCPRCKTPIRHNLRYGAYINRTLRDIEAVKCKVFNNEHEIEGKTQKVLLALLAMMKSARYLMIKPITDRNLAVLKMRFKRNLSLEELAVIENQLAFKRRIDEILKTTHSEIRNILDPEGDYDFHLLKLEFYELENKILEPRKHISKQELQDFNAELLRMGYLASHHILRLRHYPAAIPEVSSALKSVEDILTSGRKLDENIEREVKVKLNEIESDSGNLELTGQGRVQIVQTMGLCRDHWYKCPNGSIHAIPECGGETMESS